MFFFFASISMFQRRCSQCGLDIRPAQAPSRAMTIFGWGSAWQPTPWRAVQGAALAAVRA
jgi:hypothetical protein